MEELMKEKLESKAWAADIVNEVFDDMRPCVRYKEVHPISDFRDLLQTTANRYPDRVAYLQRYGKRGNFESIPFKNVLSDVNALGTVMLKQDLAGKRVAVIGPNSYQWATIYLAVTGGVGCIVPLDKELNDEELKKQILEAEVAGVAFDEKHLETFQAMKEDPDNPLEVLINCDASQTQDGVLSWLEMIEIGNKMLNDGDHDYADREIDSEIMSVLIFTSGTTAEPKGVMLSQRNICAELMTMPTLFHLGPEDRFLSFLPMHHTYECTCGFLLPLYKGASVAFCQEPRYITRDMRDAKPTVMVVVPAFIERMYRTIWKNIRKQGREKSVKRAIGMNRIALKAGLDLGGKIFRDVKNVFGGNVHTFVCGGAIVNPDVLDGLEQMGFNALQGYGLTEASPVVSFNPPASSIPKSLGVPFPGQEIKIADHDWDGVGEICVRGENVMLGYFNHPEKTAEVIDKEGWLHTGDLGYIDSDGYLYMTGRKKNIIITKNGKNVYPEELELLLNSIDFVEESFVYEDVIVSGTDGMITASIKVNNREVTSLLGADYTEEDVKNLVWRAVNKLNKKAPSYRRIGKVILRKSNFVHNTSSKLVRDDESNKNEE